MTVKKSIIFLAALAMMVAGCSEKEDVAVGNTDPNAISFSAYTSTTVTRGVVKTTADVQTGGIGVFAFYQPAVNGTKVDFNTRKFATPDFMYNQQVTYADGEWSYTPIKYWPNNPNDQVSFFAYAPYDKDKTWEDLGITTDACADKMTAIFPIYDEKPIMEDVLWHDPLINKSKPSTTSGATDNPVTFNFRHVLSKIALYVGVEINQAKGQACAWTYDHTTITINKVEFTNVASSVSSVSPILADGSIGTAEFKTSSQTQNIVLTKQNGDFRDSTSVIEKREPWTTAGFYDLLSYENHISSLCSTCGSTQDPSAGLGNGYRNAFLFLAPQTFSSGKQQVIITYTVATTDPNDPTNSSTIINTIPTDLATVLETGAGAADGKFEAGKAYTLKFLIGMNTVKFSVDVAAWDDYEYIIDVPKNTILPASAAVKAWNEQTEQDHDFNNW